MTAQQQTFWDTAGNANVKPQFDGETFDAELGGERLDTQLRRVREFMSDGQWHTLQEIEAVCGGTVASISARLRDLRKRRHGSNRVERRRKENAPAGTFEYRVNG